LGVCFRSFQGYQADPFAQAAPLALADLLIHCAIASHPPVIATDDDLAVEEFQIAGSVDEELLLLIRRLDELVVQAFLALLTILFGGLIN